MGSDYHEKDYEDEVYEDGYYEEHYEEEELAEDSSERLEEEELVEEEAVEAEEGLEVEEPAEAGWDDDDKKVTVSYACEECDYRWDDIIIKKKSALEEEEIDIICPMCGSMNVTLI